MMCNAGMYLFYSTNKSMTARGVVPGHRTRINSTNTSGRPDELLNIVER